MPGGWYFSGACATGSIDGTGGTFALRDSREISTIVSFGPSDATQPHPFVVGEAAGAGEIAGKLNGRLAFPLYGTAPCVDDRKAIRPCPGYPLLYLLVINSGNVPVAFPASPRIQIQGVDRFRSVSRCGIDTLIWSPVPGLGPVWLLHPMATAPSSANELVFAPAPRTQQYDSAGAFTAFAVVCR